MDVELITWTCIKDALATSIDAVADIAFLKTWFARLRPDKGDQVRELTSIGGRVESFRILVKAFCIRKERIGGLRTIVDMPKVMSDKTRLVGYLEI